MDEGVNVKSELCRHLCDYQITMGDPIFCGLLDVCIPVSETSHSIEIVRHAQIKRTFMVVFREDIFQRRNGCVCHAFVI